MSKELDYIPFEVNITREISPFKDFKAIFSVYRYIKKNKIEKVIGHTPKGGMIAMIASFLAGVSDRIYFRHGIIYETSSGLKKIILKNVDRLSGFLATKVVCVSNSIREISEKDKLNSASKNIILGLGTCNGIDTEYKYNPDTYEKDTINSLKSKLLIKEEDFVVGFVGRLVKDKGINELIQAWEIVKESHANVKLLLVGPIESRDSISEISKSKIYQDDTIIFTDFVLDAAPYYSLMNVFILPSYREGFPTVVLEASSMGKPVLITKATGCIEAIKEDITGVFITYEPKDIASKIFYYLKNRDIEKIHGKNGRMFVQENFEQTKIWDLISENLNI
nr:glycosyltransferase family 4 protein [Flavobacterium oncorhynchi]